MIRHTRLTFAFLALAWAVVAAWQVMEHSRVEKSGRDALVRRSHDISGTVSKLVRAQRFFGTVSQERMEDALGSLVSTDGIESIALLNRDSEIVVSVGTPIDFNIKGLTEKLERWDSNLLTVVNLVDFGTNVVSGSGTNLSPIFVRPRRDTNAPPREEGLFVSPLPRPPPGEPRPVETNFVAGGELAGTNSPPRREGFRRLPGFGRPSGMSEPDYQTMLAKRGLHGFVIALSTEPLLRAKDADFWTRTLIVSFAGVAALGVALALRNVSKSADLQFRLLRASELNTHLRELNLAAAGLAHETKNPLNIIRGLAQMISRQQDAAAEVRDRSRSIVDEADRVTAQLNEFINYSRPREVRRAPVALNAVATEVVRTLGFDLEEKDLHLHLQPDLPRIEADEQLLRQALFNLLLNGTQALDRGGEIRVAVVPCGEGTVSLEIRDDGPGVAPEHREEIFKPYFTTHQKGTGLGLAIVQQIVLAHGWEITCHPNEPRGALFRISYIKTLA